MSNRLFLLSSLILLFQMAAFADDEKGLTSVFEQVYPNAKSDVLRSVDECVAKISAIRKAKLTRDVTIGAFVGSAVGIGIAARTLQVRAATIRELEALLDQPYSAEKITKMKQILLRMKNWGLGDLFEKLGGDLSNSGGFARGQIWTSLEVLQSHVENLDEIVGNGETKNLVTQLKGQIKNLSAGRTTTHLQRALIEMGEASDRYFQREPDANIKIIKEGLKDLLQRMGTLSRTVAEVQSSLVTNLTKIAALDTKLACSSVTKTIVKAFSCITAGAVAGAVFTILTNPMPLQTQSLSDMFISDENLLGSTSPKLICQQLISIPDTDTKKAKIRLEHKLAVLDAFITDKNDRSSSINSSSTQKAQ